MLSSQVARRAAVALRTRRPPLLGDGGGASALVASPRSRSLFATATRSSSSSSSTTRASDGDDRRRSSSSSSGYEHLERYYLFSDLETTDAPRRPVVGRVPEYAHLERYYVFEDPPKEIDRTLVAECCAELVDVVGCHVSKLSTIVCNNHMKRLCRSDSVASLERADRVLTLMERLGDHVRDTVHHRGADQHEHRHPLFPVPDAYSFTPLVKALVRVGRGDRAREVMERMERAVEAGYAREAGYDVYRRAIIFASRADPGTRLEAFRGLARPDVKSLNAVLREFARKRPDEAARVLRDVCGRRATEERLKNCAPDLVSFNTVARALAERGDGAAARAVTDLLEETDGFDPDVYTHAAVVLAYCNGGDAREATKALGEMETALSEKRIEPKGIDLSLYTTVIKCWRRAKGGDGVEGAQAVVRNMEHLGDNHDHLSFLRPNTIVYNALLTVLGDHHRFDDCRRLLSRMRARSVPPDAVSLTLVCRAVARDNSRATHQRLCSLIDSFERDADEGRSNVRPDASAYRLLLRPRSHAVLEGGPAAENVLSWMEERGQRVDARTCAAAIKARTRRPGGTDEALRTLRRWERRHRFDAEEEEQHAENRSAPYDAAAEGAARDGRGDAATEVLRRMRADPRARPTAATYATVLRAVLGKDDEEERARWTIAACAEDGAVDRQVFDVVRRHGGNEGGGSSLWPTGDDENGSFETLSDLPADWTRNVERESRRDGRQRRGRGGNARSARTRPNGVGGDKGRGRRRPPERIKT